MSDNFIIDHLYDDTTRLLLGAHLYPEVDIPFVVSQIEARRAIQDKMPEWTTLPGLRFATMQSVEQASSLLTSTFKTRLVRGESLMDLTGGLGIDSVAFSRMMKEVVYIEQNPAVCEAARNNFEVLGLTNITTLCDDCRNVLKTRFADTLYIDPSRRIQSQRKYSIEEIEPNIMNMLDDMVFHSQRIIIKLSPMLDITETLRYLHEADEIYVLAVKNECKELIVTLNSDPDAVACSCKNPFMMTYVNAINILSDGREQSFRFLLEEERRAELLTADTIGEYLYEPNNAIMKAGAFRLISKRFNLSALDRNSHLYTSDTLLSDFPGRVFRTEKIFRANSHQLALLAKDYPKANITVRNFPISVKDLRHRTGITEGGEITLFATLFQGRHSVIVCRSI